VDQLFGNRIRLWTAICGTLAVLGPMLFPGRSQAATTVYPAGGSSFTGGVEGWSPGAVSCTPITLFCTPEAVYDGTAGNPPGSISARTTVTLNLISLFRGTETWNSPTFTVPVGAVTGAAVRLDRAFSPGGLVDVAPTATYTVTLRDLSTGTSAAVLNETLGGADTTFASRAAAASVVGGHSYQLSIEGATAQSTLALSLLNGTTDLRFDNVGLRVETADGGDGGGGGNDGSGSGGGSGAGSGKFSSLTDARLLALLRGATAAPAVLKGDRLFAKVSCPAKVGAACRIAAQGLLSRRKAATTRRTVKVPKGSSRQIVLRLEPKAKKQVAKRKRLLLREAVKAGSAKATLYRSRALSRR
jgi:hypothetical protein